MGPTGDQALLVPPSIQISPMILRHRVWNYCKHLISDGAIGMLGFPKVGLRLGKLVAAPLARLKDRLCCSPAVRIAGFRVFLGHCSGQSCTMNCNCPSAQHPLCCGVVVMWVCSLAGDFPLCSLLCITPAFCFPALMLDPSMS